MSCVRCPISNNFPIVTLRNCITAIKPPHPKSPSFNLSKMPSSKKGKYCLKLCSASSNQYCLQHCNMQTLSNVRQAPRPQQDEQSWNATSILQVSIHPTQEAKAPPQPRYWNGKSHWWQTPENSRCSFKGRNASRMTEMLYSHPKCLLSHLDISIKHWQLQDTFSRKQ